MKAVGTLLVRLVARLFGLTLPEAERAREPAVLATGQPEPDPIMTRALEEARRRRDEARTAEMRRDARINARATAGAKKTTRSERLPVRQGDVILVPIDAPSAEDVTPAPKDTRGTVLAEGESSGHCHRVFGRGHKLARYRDTSRVARVLFVGEDGADLRVVGGGAGGVDRHTPVKLAPGAWEVRTQRQYTAEDEAMSRQVAD